MSLNNLYTTILAPVISEKSNRVGELANQYVFKVAKTANKAEIKTAIEKLFKVNVENVSVMNVKGKTKSFRMKPGKRPDWKKAYVRIQADQMIDFGTKAE
ncbi:50S ribosomal protein L23 [Marinicella sp. S1101]|uniref:50S ribosomal protein L23 n=1 Tax=Marinicella marina TaxID=2996016 RepID=UPI002260E1A2|nr:50S ribosomal protein L23 [Marinicella marina]MCX7555090.1 50S ribosomal protein L23 [Marinicella marina]MDJ1140299.1 50S ribosomal protein L23 [Marinicella marina]